MESFPCFSVSRRETLNIRNVLDMAAVALREQRGAAYMSGSIPRASLMVFVEFSNHVNGCFTTKGSADMTYSLLISRD